jgi:hypothetical protein
MSTPQARPLEAGAVALALASLVLAAQAYAGDHKDTPLPADHQCDFVNYFHDETKNPQGPGACRSDCDCDGMRSCVSGTCSGTARPEKLTAESCNREDYHYRESWTPAGPGKCSGDCECDGLRTCVSGQCSGVARDTPVPADGQCDFVNYNHNEAKNKSGPGTCAGDCDCDGLRSCVAGKCTGKARPEKLNAEVCNREDYFYRESWTPSGPGTCSSDCECDGLRKCTSGRCTGTAHRHAVPEGHRNMMGPKNR